MNDTSVTTWLLHAMRHQHPLEINLDGALYTFERIEQLVIPHTITHAGGEQIADIDLHGLMTTGAEHHFSLYGRSLVPGAFDSHWLSFEGNAVSSIATPPSLETSQP